MQTILGAGGAIGVELAKSLPAYTTDVRLVARNPEKVNESDQLFPADLTNQEAVMRAVEGSEVAYLTVGLPYDINVWESIWPVIMKNVLEACKEQGAKLVFFDNIYMYPKDSVGELRETNPVNPQTRKGKVRAEIANQLMDAVEAGEIQALIARAADFYGPGISKVSVLTETVFKPLSIGKKASVLGSADTLHSYTYTPDAGKATAMLGNSSDAYGQVWHLPTSSQEWTTRDFIEEIAKGLDTRPRFQVAGKTLVGILAWFNPLMKELKEMLYQYEQDYRFVSEKFEKRFDFEPTTYEVGIKEVIEKDYPPC